MKKKIVIMMVLLLAVVGAKAQEVENPVGRFSVIPRNWVSPHGQNNGKAYTTIHYRYGFQW